MSLTRTITSAAVALALAAGLQAPLTSAASAGDWRGRGYGYAEPRPHWGAAPPRAYHYVEPRRRNVGGEIAKGVAIGIGAAVVGAILADQARRTRDEYYD